MGLARGLSHGAHLSHDMLRRPLAPQLQRRTQWLNKSQLFLTPQCTKMRTDIQLPTLVNRHGALSCQDAIPLLSLSSPAALSQMADNRRRDMAAWGPTSRHPGEKDGPLGAKRQLHVSTISDTLSKDCLAAAATHVAALGVYVNRACSGNMIADDTAHYKARLENRHVVQAESEALRILRGA